MTVTKKKAELRAALRQARADLAPARRARSDARILGRLVAEPCWQEARLVCTYLSFGAEVDTYTLIERAWFEGKAVAIPRCVRRSEVRPTGDALCPEAALQVEAVLRGMRWYRLESFDGLVRGGMGVLEPDPMTFEELDPFDGPLAGGSSLAIVPGLAFDQRGYRIGYGGGYYDTFLARFAGNTVGLCREEQLVASLAELGVLEGHDLPVDLVIAG